MTVSLDKVFEALASGPKRQILAYLTEKELSTTGLAERFAMSTPAFHAIYRCLKTPAW